MDETCGTQGGKETVYVVLVGETWRDSSIGGRILLKCISKWDCVDWEATSFTRTLFHVLSLMTMI